MMDKDKLNHARSDRQGSGDLPICKMPHVSMWTLLSKLMPLLRNDLIYMPSEWGHINIMHDLHQLYRCLNLRTFKLFESYSYLADWYSNWRFTAIQVYLRTQSSHKYCWAYPIVGYLLLPFNFLQLWEEDHFSPCHISDLPNRHEKLLVSFLSVMSCARNVKHRFVQPWPTNNVKHKSMGGQRWARKPAYKLGFVTGAETACNGVATFPKLQKEAWRPTWHFSSAVSEAGLPAYPN